ncbi:MAG: hypothetical protein WCV50_04025 [Patescibacteria group bacterium]|jgi:transketolase
MSNPLANPKPGTYTDVRELDYFSVVPLTTVGFLVKLFEYYRAQCTVLYNFALSGEGSGHPGGSISAGRIMLALLLESTSFDITQPRRPDADRFIQAEGHTALGGYAVRALFDEFARVDQCSLLQGLDDALRLRLVDLLRFRHNSEHNLPLSVLHNSKSLGGHPDPSIPFVDLATGASGVGECAAVGRALTLLDHFGRNAPWVHFLTGEGSMTPGRVAEAAAIAASGHIWNLVGHVNFNNCSINSDRVCPADGQPGDYMQCTPAGFYLMHGWNVYEVDGTSFPQIIMAQRLARQQNNGLPTAIVYHTIKGEGYGIEGRKSHGAGHPFCSEAYYHSLAGFEAAFGVQVPRRVNEESPVEIEKLYFNTLMTFRQAAEMFTDLPHYVGERIVKSHDNLGSLNRTPRKGCPQLGRLYDGSGGISPEEIPADLVLQPGTKTTLRLQQARVLRLINKITGGALICCSADLDESTSIIEAARDFAMGFWDAAENPYSRLLAIGIREDGGVGAMTGACEFNMGVVASYGGFLSAMGHTAARLHCDGEQGYSLATGSHYRTVVLVNAHTGYGTGPDGASHADGQCTQLFEGNFPLGFAITLTPWSPDELYSLTVAGLLKRPAVLASFVTRPAEVVLDRVQYGLPPATAAAKGVYAFRTADPTDPQYRGTIFLQGSAVTYEFIQHVLLKIDEAGWKMNVFYIASRELYELLSAEEQRAIVPDYCLAEGMGITDFTMPTMEWMVGSRFGREYSLHAFSAGYFPGSDAASAVLKEMGMDGLSQLLKVQEYAEAFHQKFHIK